MMVIILWKNLENVGRSGTEKLNYSCKGSSAILDLETSEVT